jgi:hypothetical protein
MKQLATEIIYTACFFGLLFVAFKLGQASEIIRFRDEVLDTPEVQPASRASEGREHGRPGPSGVSSIYDQEAEPVNGLFLTLLGRTVTTR